MGDPKNADIWADADVYTAPLGTANPATIDDPFGSGWDQVGLLDGDDGFVFARSEDVGDKFAWGGILVRTSRRNFKQTVKFNALEDNATTRALVWPGSTSSQLKIPKPDRLKIAFEIREGDTVKRLISNYEAEVSVEDDIVEQEADPTKYGLLATIFPSAGGILFDIQETIVVS